MKLLIATIATLLISGSAYAGHKVTTDEFNEAVGNINDSINSSNLTADAGASAATALASIPHATGANGAVGVAVGKYGTGRALALGFAGHKGNVNYKAGVSFTNRDETAIGAGMSYNF